MEVRKFMKRAVPIVLTAAILQIPSIASAAPTNMSVTPSSPLPSATSVKYTVTTTGGWSATPVKCLRMTWSATVGGAGLPASMAVTGAVLDAATTGAGTVANWGTGVVTGNKEEWTNTGTQTIGAGNLIVQSITNPNAAGSYYLRVETFSGVCGTGPLDNVDVAFAITDSTLVSVTVDPTFTFAVNSQATGVACNGLPVSTVTSTSSSVPFGPLAGGARAFGVQQLTVTSNAANGWVVNMKSTAATANVLKGGATRTIADVTAGAVPAAGNAFFGYSADSANPTITAANVKPVPQTSGSDVVATGTIGTGINRCVGFAVGASGSTAADTYSATIIYTAVPTF